MPQPSPHLAPPALSASPWSDLSLQEAEEHPAVCKEQAGISSGSRNPKKLQSPALSGFTTWRGQRKAGGRRIKAMERKRRPRQRGRRGRSPRSSIHNEMGPWLAGSIQIVNNPAEKAEKSLPVAGEKPADVISLEDDGGTFPFQQELEKLNSSS